MINEIISIRKKVEKNAPLIHSITNPISINDCANFVLTTGAKPIMAEHPSEVEEITALSSALALNIANITDARMKSMPLAAQTANSHNIPVIIDVVGVNCSSLRLNFVNELLNKVRFSVIKGNIAEINALMGIKTETTGIDVKSNGDIETNKKTVMMLAQKYNCTVLASGKIDIISDGNRVVIVKNGRKEMSLITGTGCILNVLAATYMSQSTPFIGCIAATTLFGICGQLAEYKNGLASYKNNILDKLYTITDDEIKKYIDIL